MKRFISVLAMGVAMLAATAPAEAALLRAVYSGIIGEGYDQNGIFGTAGADLAGDTFTATFIYDTAIAGSTSSSGAWGQEVHGGENFVYGSPSAPVSPMLSANVVINGHSYNQYTGFYGYIGVFPDPYVAHIALVSTLDGPNAEESFITAVAAVAPMPLSINAHLAPTWAKNLGGGFEHYVTHDDGLTATDYTYGTFGDQVLVSIGGVPEPASWALMIGGFGMVGGALRNRRRALA